ncbi:MAG: zinc-binding dehydrogenase [Solirubrobacteraceae bacterium]|nr:zinc-binding dehydrogenase [Solirubrobacteraceae bacterium]
MRAAIFIEPGTIEAGRIIARGRNPARREFARSLGATDIVAARGEEAVETVKETTDGVGVEATLECVGPASRARSPGLVRWSA